MTPQNALILITEIRKSKIPKDDVAFTNSIEHWAKSGRPLTEKQAWRLQEVYRKAQGHYKRMRSNVF